MIPAQLPPTPIEFFAAAIANADLNGDNEQAVFDNVAAAFLVMNDQRNRDVGHLNDERIRVEREVGVVQGQVGALQADQQRIVEDVDALQNRIGMAQQRNGRVAVPVAPAHPPCFSRDREDRKEASRTRRQKSAR